MEIKNIKLVLDSDNELLDVPCRVEVMGKDTTPEYLALIDLPMNDIDKEEKIHKYLDTNFENQSSIKIELNLHYGFIIYDEVDNILREIPFKKDFTTDRDARIKELIFKLVSVL